MNEHNLDDLELQLTGLGRAFNFPPTPDIAGQVSIRLVRKPGNKPARLVWLVGAFVLLLCVLMAVPPVRAQILDFIQIGVIRIFTAPPSSTPSLPEIFKPTIQPSTVNPSPQVTLSPNRGEQPVPVLPSETATLLPSLLDLAGETTLAEAQTKLDFPIPLPTYPADLGPPDRVFLQDAEAPMLVLVWLSPGSADQIELSLHIFGTGSMFATKWEPRDLVATTVDGQPAVWAEGPYIFKLKNGEFAFDRLIQGHVLVWSRGELTYRLESNLSMDSARKIAASLKPIDNATAKP